MIVKCIKVKTKKELKERGSTDQDILRERKDWLGRKVIKW